MSNAASVSMPNIFMDEYQGMALTEDNIFNRLIMGKLDRQSFFDDSSSSDVVKKLIAGNSVQVTGTAIERQTIAVNIQKNFEEVLFRLLKHNPSYQLEMVSHTALPPTPLSTVSVQQVIDEAPKFKNHDAAQRTVTDRTVTLHQLLSCGNQFKYFCFYDTPRKEQQADNFRKIAEKYQDTLFPIKTKVEGSAEALTGATYYLTHGKNEIYVFGIRITQANKVSENGEGEARLFQGAIDNRVIKEALAPLDQLMEDHADASPYSLYT
ncbi:hypothetical protein [Yersinia sp. Marseille-Q3913]|uniref:hypothetical protein n=1 Tax=Yersinia sp. Marseille-Q3913 TaxID=2830769 RepID=UPI001BAEF59D|nr:hypothetical protein [Yersinia sp. Marseille-Q3913]MBS0057514.1 hypothetical protein [Yersinia sp. Marseille-Q3913]